MNISSSEAVAVPLLEALGIDKTRVAALTIECRPHSVAQVTVEIFLSKEDIQSITGTIQRRFKLVEA